jgi:CubicO group peptidase (beta-lactamase class C family)
MPRSYFGVPPAENLPHASGHTRVRDVLIPVAILLGPGTMLMLAAVSVMTRIIRGRWMPSLKGAVAGLVPAIAAVTWFLYARSGSMALSAYFVGCFLALGTAALGAGALLAWSLARTVPARFAWLARMAGVLAGLAAVLAFALPRFIPVPSWFPEEGNAASSLRSTAGDLGRFLGELSRPQLLRPEMATAFRTAQVRVNGDISWGLGIGIQHSGHGDALWHLGSNPASKAFFAVYPAHGLGVVVLTNSDGSLALAREIAARALGGKASWSLASDP